MNKIKYCILLILGIFIFYSCVARKQLNISNSNFLLEKIIVRGDYEGYYNGLFYYNWVLKIEEICRVNRLPCYIEESPEDPLPSDRCEEGKCICIWGEDKCKSWMKYDEKVKAKLEEMVYQKSIAQILNNILKDHPAYYWEFNRDNSGVLNIIPKPGKEHIINNKPFSKYKIKKLKERTDHGYSYIAQIILQRLNIVPRHGFMTGFSRLIRDKESYNERQERLAKLAKEFPPIELKNISIREAYNKLMSLEKEPMIWEFYYDKDEKDYYLNVKELNRVLSRRF
ncbi:hypothetical protein KKG71_03875 [Patescibacteria group bacterium]|nr:hypothetical protein [Patescibacteria group bacterium]